MNWRNFTKSIFKSTASPNTTHVEEQEETEDKPDIATTLVCQLHRHYKSTLYLNLYENH